MYYILVNSTFHRALYIICIISLLLYFCLPKKLFCFSSFYSYFFCVWYKFYCMFSRFHNIRASFEKMLVSCTIQSREDGITHQFLECYKLWSCWCPSVPTFAVIKCKKYSIATVRVLLSSMSTYVLPNSMYDSIRLCFFFSSEILLKIIQTVRTEPYHLWSWIFS